MRSTRVVGPGRCAASLGGITRMGQDELIKIARKLAVGMAQNAEERASVAALTEVKVRTAALISFRGTGSKASVDVYLDQQTGEFVTASYTLG